MDVETAKYFAGALALLPAFGSAIGLSLYFKSYNEALARNPEVKNALEEKFFLVVAFIEALGIIPIGIGAAIIFGG